MFEFGAGSLWGQPVGGNTTLPGTPSFFGTLQDVSLDISGDVKQLYGQKQFPEAVARGKCKITGKAKYAWINAKQMNDLFFSQTLTAGMIKIQSNEQYPIPAVTPFTVTVAPPASSTYLNDTLRGDQGVRYATTGVPLTKVASPAAAGQYSVDVTQGKYTFFSADASANVFISYMYTPAAATGTQINVTNQFMGFAPTVQMVLEAIYNNNQFNVVLYNCLVSKLAFATKQEDFIIPEMDFEAFANPAGKVLDIYSSE
jgi:hypothetical protein